MEEFDWIEDHKILPDPSNVKTFEEFEFYIPSSITISEYADVKEVSIWDKRGTIRLRDLLRQKLWPVETKEGKRMHVPFINKFIVKIKENRNYIPDSHWKYVSQEQKDKMTTVEFYVTYKKDMVMFKTSVTSLNYMYRHSLMRLDKLKKNPIL